MNTHTLRTKVTTSADYRFVNFHMLKSYSASCLNRDDNQMPKEMHFGGVKRLRFSSQCFKKAMRTSEAYREAFAEEFEFSIRTTDVERLVDHICGTVLSEGEETDRDIVRCVVSAGMTNGATMAWIPGEIRELVAEAKNFFEENDDAAITPAALADVIAGAKKKKNGKTPAASGDDSTADEEETSVPEAPEEEKAGKKKDSKGKKAPVNKEAEAAKQLTARLAKKCEEMKQAGFSALDIALSGRMCAASCLEGVEASMAVAHSFTVNPYYADIDSFVTTDDLKVLGEGAGFLSDNEFGSGTFYTYASINLDLLARNMGLGADAEGRKKALEVVSYLAKVFMTVTPSGKQNSYAARPYADYFFVTLSNGAPLSLANAFEAPVRSKDGYIAKSIEALEDYWTTIRDAYELDDKCAVFTTAGTKFTDNDGVSVFRKLSGLIGWIQGE